RGLLTTALAPSPARRFQTVAEFVGELAPPTDQPTDQLIQFIPEPARPRGSSLVRLGAAAAALVTLTAGLWLFWGTPRPTLAALTRTRVQESGAVTRPERDSVPARSPAPVASVPHASPRPPVDPGHARAAVSPDSAPGPRISPFRRSHPWVAVAGERFYYRSTCPAALESRDLLFFRTEEEARASGFIRSQVTGCN
ncbi:MAG: hypothetical protein ACJ8DC_12975, partial [Gemmatimonadales bacterium]